MAIIPTDGVKKIERMSVCMTGCRLVRIRVDMSDSANQLPVADFAESISNSTINVETPTWGATMIVTSGC